MPSQSYYHQAKRLLENTFPGVSCKAIEIIFQACNYKLKLLNDISPDLGYHRRQISSTWSSHSKACQSVHQNYNRPRKQSEVVSDRKLLAEIEIDDIPGLSEKMKDEEASTLRRDRQKSYKHSCSLVRIPQRRVDVLCTYSDESEEKKVHGMLLPLIEVKRPFNTTISLN